MVDIFGTRSTSQFYHRGSDTNMCVDGRLSNTQSGPGIDRN